MVINEQSHKGGLEWVVKVNQVECLCWILVVLMRKGHSGDDKGVLE